MANSAERAVLFHFAADLFEASPRLTFERDEVVNILRKLPEEIEHQLELANMLEGMALPSPSAPS